MSAIIKKTVTVGDRKMKVMLERYNSAIDVVNDCKERKLTDSRFHDYTKESLRSWHGVKTYEEALDYMRNGYQPVVQKLKADVKNLKIGNGQRVTFRNNMVGFAPVVPLALMNVPNNMIDTKIKTIKRKVIDVYYDMTFSAGTEPDEIIKTGSKLLGVIIKLEQEGYKFNLYAVQGYSKRNDADMLAVKIKSSTQPIDLTRMSFPLTHVAFFRVIGFDWYGRCPEAKYRSCYGSAVAYNMNKEEQRQFGKDLFGDNAIYISGVEIKNGDEDYIKEVLLSGQR